MTSRLDFTAFDLMDALDLAILIESEAYERYRMFSSQLGHRAPGDAASVFAGMAENEAKHGKELLKRRTETFGDKPVRVTMGDLFDVEAPEQGAPSRNMSARQAFELALSSEQKAFDFFNQALAHVTDPSIIALFTELRDEEVEHLRMVRGALETLPASADAEWEDDNEDYPAL